MITVRQDADGSVDEVIADMASVHLEALGNGNWYLRISSVDDVERELTVNITRKRAFVYESRNCEIQCNDNPRPLGHDP